MNRTEQFQAKQEAMSDKELIELVEKQIHELARTGGRSHRMCVPPMITDTDMLLCELVKRFTNKGKWISVLEGNPKVGQKVLCVQDPTKSATKEALYAIWDGAGFMCMTPMIFANYEIGKSRYSDITKWMPLPETL